MAEIYNDKGLHQRKASELGISASAAAAVLHVESGGRGFSGDGRMIIRFENHVFWDEWGRANPTLYNTHFTHSSNQRWKGHKFRKSPNEPFESFHGMQGKEWEVLQFCTFPFRYRCIEIDFNGCCTDYGLQSIKVLGTILYRKCLKRCATVFRHS